MDEKIISNMFNCLILCLITVTLYIFWEFYSPKCDNCCILPKGFIYWSLLHLIIILLAIYTIVYFVSKILLYEKPRDGDIWCETCNKYVKYWSSHVYTEEHQDNLFERFKGNLTWKRNEIYICLFVVYVMVILWKRLQKGDIMDKCNFKKFGHVCSMRGNSGVFAVECEGEDNCFLFQIYKKIVVRWYEKWMKKM